MEWWKLLMAGAALAVGVSSDERNGWAKNHEYGGVHSEFKLGSDDFGRGGVIPDRVEVVSSALRILPRKSASVKEKSLGDASRVARAADDVDEEGSKWALVPTKSVDRRTSSFGPDIHHDDKTRLSKSGLSVHDYAKSSLSRLGLDVHHDANSMLPSSGLGVHHDAKSRLGSSGLDVNRNAKSWLSSFGPDEHDDAKTRLSSSGLSVHHDAKSKLDSFGLDAHNDDKSMLASSGLDVHHDAEFESKKSEWVTKVRSGFTVDNAERAKRSSGGNWRTPREYQFVTRERSNDGAPRSSRLLEPESSASRYYPDERPYYPESRRDDYFGRRSGEYRAPTKRIIYYATLPEIVRRPGEWTPPRPIYGGGFRNNPRDNEILPRPDGPFSDGGTRVSSGVIGFSDKHETLKNPGYQDDLSSPTFTIIDAEPPYNYGHHSGPPPPPLPDRFDNRYDQDRYDYDRYKNRYDQERYDYDRYDQRYNSYRNNYANPYRQYYDRRPPPQAPRHPQITLPPQPITIVRKPLDVRPLDPDTDYTTQGPPHASSTSSSSSSSTSTTSSPQLSSYERTFERKFSN